MANTKKSTWKSTIPYYGTAIVWMMYALRIDLCKIGNFLLVAFIAVGIFLLLDEICKDEVAKREDVAPAKPEDKSTGNTELDEVIKNGRYSLHKMRQINLRIRDEKISADINRVEGATQKIFDHIRVHPEKLPQIRRFLNYYLPMTLKLLITYDNLNATGISGKNIENIMVQISNMMGRIASAFGTQLDKLFGNEVLDIASDIVVMENILRQEGLIGEYMEAEYVQSSESANTGNQT